MYNEEKQNKSLKFLLLVIITMLIPNFTSSIFDLKQINIIKINQEKILAKEKEKKQIENELKIYLTGHFDQSTRDDFILIPPQYQIEQNKIYLRKETLNAFIKMQKLAKKNGISLKILSATRNFDYQKDLWEKKWIGVTLVDGQNLSKTFPDELERFKKILEYSAVPGTSRHHWGTDIDINDANPAYFEKGKGKKEYNWLVKNAPLFGFCQVYNKKDSQRPTGYNEEKWHWSYLPLAKSLTQEYKRLITDIDISGFEGEKYVTGFNLINNYVLSINPACK